MPTQDSLCNFALSEADRQIHAASSTKVKGFEEPRMTFASPEFLFLCILQGYMAELPPADPATLPSLRRRIDKYATAFHEDAVSLASSLHVHADQVRNPSIPRGLADLQVLAAHLYTRIGSLGLALPCDAPQLFSREWALTESLQFCGLIMSFLSIMCSGRARKGRGMKGEKARRLSEYRCQRMSVERICESMQERPNACMYDVDYSCAEDVW